MSMVAKVGEKQCTRCGYRWEPRVEEPKQCPRCKSPAWDKPYTRTQWAKDVGIAKP